MFLHCPGPAHDPRQLEDVLLAIHIIPIDAPKAIERYKTRLLSEEPYYCCPLIKQLFRLIIDFGVNRKLICTENYIGLGPIGTRIGDAIYFMSGAETPFVLRELGSEFMVIGECVMVQPSMQETCGACGRTPHYNEFCDCEVCQGYSHLERIQRLQMAQLEKLTLS